jgi:SagB-type dehydrogenase family enzyme
MPGAAHQAKEVAISMRIRFMLLRLALVTSFVYVAGCAKMPVTPGTPTIAAQQGEIRLPEPSLAGDVSLEEAIARRRSVREFTDEPLTREEVSQLLWAAQGITDPRGLRAAPSAGALYPLEVFVVLPEGVYRYSPQGHALTTLLEGDRRGDLWEAGLEQDALRQAAAIFVVAGVYERTEGKYGERAERYVKLEAGHAAQNLLLQAVVLDLGAVPIGAFYDDEVQAALALPGDHFPLYLISVGHPQR